LLSPLPKRLVPGSQLAFLDNPTVGGFYAVTDAFLVNIESDI
jgi:hypothetical protein